MEFKKANPGASASLAGLKSADKQISVLCDKVLPHMPHILSVPTKTPYQPVFPHENQCTPFDSWEVMKLQYVTLISNADRGVGYAHGNWEDAINAQSPSNGDLPSSTSTPNPARDSKKTPAVKMSIADYKNLKSTGAKPTPKPVAATPDSRPRNDAHDPKPTHSRNTSNVSVNTPMARGPSLEGPDHRTNGVGASIKKTGPPQISPGREDLPAPKRNLLDTRDPEIPRGTVNGNAPREFLPAKDTNKDLKSLPKPLNNMVKPPLRHALPPRPQSPRRNPESKPQKRPFESGDGSQSEKPAKIDHTQSRTPSSQSKPTARKPDTNDIKPSPPKAQKLAHLTSSQRSPLPKKVATPKPKPVDTKSSSSKPSASGKPDLPPLLSPLPADLEPPSQGFESLKKPETSRSQPRTPSQNSKGIESDTIVVKQPHAKKDITSSSSLSSPPPKPSPPFVLPRLLSPDLPDVIEAELLRLQQKSVTFNSNSIGVEARHKKVRRPGAPGVAQKRLKVGHPPKKTNAESSGPVKKAGPEKFSLIVKLSYKKAAGKRIVSLLRLPSRPTKEFKDREASKKKISAPPASDKEDSEFEDVPLAASRAKKAPISAPNSGKKRPAESSSRNEPAPKRPKGPDSINIARASTTLAPPFKSPALDGPSVSKDFGLLLSTPKKGDAMKSVAMRRVDSTDGHARTPQPASTSTPVSAEKPRTKPKKVVNPEKLSIVQKDEALFFPLGTTLKRKMQATLAKEGVAEEERKAGVMRGLESIMAYMLAFHFRDRIDDYMSRPNSPSSWEQFFLIWKFVEGNTRQYPELSTLVGQLGAISWEQLSRIYVKIEEPKNWEKLAVCLVTRDQLWMAAKEHERYLTDIGIHGILGPWTTVHDAVGFGVATLSYYAYSQKMSWEGDAHFANAPSGQYMTKGVLRFAPKEAKVERDGGPE